MSLSLKFKPYLMQTATYRGGSSAPGKHKLSSNENPWGPSPKVIEGLPWLLDELNYYPEVQDNALRESLSDAYKQALSTDCFITGNGGSEILEVIMRGFLEPGDQCIYSTPAFIPYWEFSKKFGATPIDVPLLKDSYALDVDKVLAAINEMTRLVFLTSPNNPTGNIIPKEQLTYYFSQVPSHVVTVFDEVYCHYVTNEEQYSIALPFVLSDMHVIGLNSFSKAYGLAGLRVGYAYSTKQIASYLRSIKRPFGLNKVSMTAANLALSDLAYLASVKDKCQAAKSKIYNAFDKMHLNYCRSEANFILLKVNNSTKATDYLYKEGVIVRPLDAFGAQNCIRISIGSDEAIGALLHAIEKQLTLFQS